MAKIANMDTISVTATELKNNAAEIVDRIRYESKTVIIKKHGKPVAKISPYTAVDAVPTLDSTWSKYFGALPDFPDVTKDRVSRKRWPKL